MALEIILVDATQQPVERHQKNSGISTAAKKVSYQEGADNYGYEDR